MNRVNGLVPVVSRMVSRRLRLGNVHQGLAKVRTLFRGRSSGWPKDHHLDECSAGIPAAGKVNPEILNVFQTPRSQRAFMIQWVNIAMDTIRSGLDDTEIQRDCLNLLRPIEKQLNEIKARRLISAEFPDQTNNVTACLTLSITLGTPEETLDFFFRIWQFAILSKTHVRVHWTFDRLKLKVNMKEFVPYTASWVLVDHFTGIFPCGKSIHIDHFGEKWKATTFAGLWSVFFGWVGWVASCGKKVGGLVLPHPVFSRFYVTDDKNRISYLHLRPDFGGPNNSLRVLATLFRDGECTPREFGDISHGQSGYAGQSGLITCRQK